MTKQLSRNGEFEDISIDVRCGEIVVITGLIGSGRTELLETLFRARRPDTGEIFLGGRGATPPLFEARYATELS